MNRARNNRSNPRRQKGQGKGQGGGADLWRLPAAELPPVEPIVVPSDVGALLRSLGDPPMRNGVVAAGYFGTVVQRAAGLALALAYSADLVADEDDEDDDR
jgi:hypothetical protein